MKKTLKSLLLVMAMLCLAVAGFGFPAKAAGSARISFSDVNCKVGETFTVNMSVNASGATLAAMDAVLLYPTDYLELVSCSVPSPGSYNSPGAGTIIMNWYNASGSGTLNCSLTFKSLKAGSTAVTVESQEIADTDGNVLSSSAASSAIAIGAESGASDDASLSALQISPGSLSPAFSPDRTEYSIQVNNDVAKIAVSAKTKHANAKFVISSTDLTVGDNTITVKVTAEDGKTVKNYVIKVKRLEGAATTTTKAAESSKEDDAGETEEGGESSEDITVMIDGQIRMFVTPLDGVTLPEGYEVTDYEFDGHQVQAARSLTGNLIVFYLADQDGENPQFYLYNEADQTFSRMMNIQTASNLYTVVDLDAGVVLPDNYHEITVEIDGLDVRAWRSNDEMEGIYYLIYAMNWNGEKALYRYDSQERTMQRADMTSLYAAGSDSGEPETETSIEDLQEKLDQADQEKQKDKSELPGWVKYVVIGLLALIIIFALVMLFLKNNGGRDEERLARLRESGRRNDYGKGREPGAGTRHNTGADYENGVRYDAELDDGSGAGRQSSSSVQGEDSSQPMPTPPNASELSSMLNQLDQEKEDNEFEIFDL